MGGGFLYYWRTHGRDYGLGCPISEEENLNGVQVQYFPTFRLEYHPENAGTTWEFSRGLIGTEIFNTLTPEAKANPAYAFITQAPESEFRTYFPQTGHTISFGMREFWQKNGDLFNFGLPLSEEYPYFNGDKNYTAQDFERVRFLYRVDTGVILENLGYASAKLNQISTEAVQRDPKIPVYSTNYWEHWVEVNLTYQVVYFMEGDLAIRSNYVTTGKPGHETPTGTYYINQRVANERMRGGSIGAGDIYDLDNVLYTQYFTGEGHALHYAWWRSRFGVTGSHGCVNMDYDTSLFAWNYVGVGSRVVIHY